MSTSGDSDEEPDETSNTGRDLLEHLVRLNTLLTGRNVFVPSGPTPDINDGLKLSLPLTSLLDPLLEMFQSIPGITAPLRDDTVNLAGMFLPSRNESESEMLEKRMTQWSTQQPDEHATFSQAFATGLSSFLNGDYKSLVRKPQSSLSTLPVALQSGNYDDVLGSLMKLLQDPFIESLATCINDALVEVFRQARNNNNGISKVPQPSDKNHKTILDLSAIHGKYLDFLLQLFISQNQCTEDSLQRLVKYMPTKTVQKKCTSPERTPSAFCANCNQPILTNTQACFECGKLFCNCCPVEHTKVPSLGHTRPVPVCLECFRRCNEQEKNEWMERSMQLLAGEPEDIQAAFACLLMGLHACDYNSNYAAIRQTNKFAKQLIEQEYPELALPLLSATSLQKEMPTQSIHAHMLASRALESMAYNPNTLPIEQIPLLKAAIAECEAASKVCSTMVEIPDMSTRIASLQKTLTVIESEDLRQLNRAKQIAFVKLQRAWNTENWDEIFKMMADTADEHLVRTDQRNPTMEAIKDIVKIKKDEILPQRRTVILLLTGFVNIFQRKISEGIANIESAVWHGLSNSSLLYTTAADIVVGVMIHNPEFVHPLHVLHSACNMIADGSSLHPTKVLPSLHLKEENLMPPFQLQWPHYGVDQTMSQVHHFATFQYEDNINKQIEQKKWTAKKAATAYLDFITRCHDEVEVAVCYLNASLWLLKSLQEKVDDDSASPSDVYSLKMAVLHYLTQAFIIAHSCLHPGMRLYVARIAVGASLVAVKLAGVQAMPNDAERIVQFLYSFVNSARLCPFWNSPIIRVSEADLLKVMTGKQHSAFISALQHIPKEFCPLKQAELTYQVYENELTSLRKSKNPEQLKHQAMQELLKEKQLTSEDVSSLMKSSLSLRCSEGWIDVQQPATMNLDYSEIKGLKVHLGGTSVLDEPALDLLVISSDGKNGIVSQSDVDTFLTLEPQNIVPLYFSLDPPSRNEKYHPFQELRFHPEGIRNTAVLQTLFEADYIMKFFSIGSEISANPPFNQKPCIEGILSKLPPHLKEALKPVHQRGKMRGNMFRFWIEAKEVKYDIQVTGNVVTVKCGDPEMIIRNHRIYFSPDGKVRDTEDDSDPDSPQALFAADLTKHYDEIGCYFPAFSRIKELCKLQLLTNYVKNNVVEFESGVLKSWAFKHMVTDVESNAKTCLTRALSSKTCKHTLPCLWVPSAVYKVEDGHHMLLSYGGVNLAPHYVKSSLPPLPITTKAITLTRRQFSSVPSQTTSYGPSNTHIPAASSQKLKTDDDSSSTSSSSSGSFAPAQSLKSSPSNLPSISSESGTGSIRSQKQSSRSKHHSGDITLSATSSQNRNPHRHGACPPHPSAFRPQHSAYNTKHHTQLPSTTVKPPVLTNAKMDTTTYASSFSPHPHSGHRPNINHTSAATSGSKPNDFTTTSLRPSSTTQSSYNPPIATTPPQLHFKKSARASSSAPYATAGSQPELLTSSYTAASDSGSKLQPHTSESCQTGDTGSKQQSYSKATGASTQTEHVLQSLPHGTSSPLEQLQLLMSTEHTPDVGSTFVSMIPKQVLPIARAFLSQVSETLSTYSHLFQHPVSTLKGKHGSTGCGVATYTHNKSSSTARSAGSNGGSGSTSGNSSEGVPFTTILRNAVADMWFVVITKTSQVRYWYMHKKYKKFKKCTDPEMHAAHLFSLEIFVHVSRLVDYPIGRDVSDQVTQILNPESFANFDLVPRKVNQVDHRRHDLALISGDHELLSQLNQGNCKDRAAEQLQFYFKYLADILPRRYLEGFLDLFCSVKLLTRKEAAKHLKKRELQGQKAVSPSPGTGGKDE